MELAGRVYAVVNVELYIGMGDVVILAKCAGAVVIVYASRRYVAIPARAAAVVPACRFRCHHLVAVALVVLVSIGHAGRQCPGDSI